MSSAQNPLQTGDPTPQRVSFSLFGTQITAPVLESLQYGPWTPDGDLYRVQGPCGIIRVPVEDAERIE